MGSRAALQVGCALHSSCIPRCQGGGMLVGALGQCRALRVCEGETERASAVNCSNSSGVSCGSCLPAQSNSVPHFRGGNEESWTRLKLQGGF